MVGGRGVYPPRCGAKRNGGNIRAGARERRGGKGNIHPNSGQACGRGSGQEDDDVTCIARERGG